MGCGTTPKTENGQKAAENGFKYIEGVGWFYTPSGHKPDDWWLTPNKLMDHVDKAMKEERYDDAMFGAKFFIQKFPAADSVPKMRRIVAQIEKLQKTPPNNPTK